MFMSLNLCHLNAKDAAAKWILLSRNIFAKNVISSSPAVKGKTVIELIMAIR